MSEIDTRNDRSTSCESDQVNTGATADFEHELAPAPVKGHEFEQVVKLLEMIPIEVVEETARADRMPCDLEVVNVPRPVRTHLVYRRHARTITAQRDRMAHR